MTDRAQFEAMLEALINEDQETAKEIFHNIVVGKSREIYEELLESDFSKDQGNPYGQTESADEEEDDVEAPADDMDMDMDSEEDDMDSADDEMDMDSEDDMDMGSEDDGAIEDRVMDLEDALEDLKAEFEQLLAGEEHEEETGVAGDHGGALDGMDGMDGGDEMDMGGEPDMVMEYVNKVPSPKHGDNGVNTRSAVAGKNDMGGTTANIAKSFSTEKGGTQGGLLKPTTTLQDGGNMNKPGATAGKSAFKKKEPGHGAETKGKSETADNKQSLLRQAKR
jgi:hypothetical protein